MTSPNCELCNNFQVGYSPSDKNICRLTGKSAIWERAGMVGISIIKGAKGDTDEDSIGTNCGPDGRLFEARL